jgi:hypothetical protein
MPESRQVGDERLQLLGREPDRATDPQGVSFRLHISSYSVDRLTRSAAAAAPAFNNSGGRATGFRRASAPGRPPALTDAPSLPKGRSERTFRLGGHVDSYTTNRQDQPAKRYHVSPNRLVDHHEPWVQGIRRPQTSRFSVDSSRTSTSGSC